MSDLNRYNKAMERTKVEALMENTGFRKCQIEIGELITRELITIRDELLKLHRDAHKEDSLLKKQEIYYDIMTLRGKQNSLKFIQKSIQSLTPPEPKHSN